MAPSPIQLPHILLNPHAGARFAASFLERILAPFFTALPGWPEPIVHATAEEGDGARVGREIRRWADERGQEEVVVLVLGGDGSSYELINGFFAAGSPSSSAVPAPGLQIVPLPLGTANALFSHLSLAPPSPLAQKQESGPLTLEKAREKWWGAYLAEGTGEEDVAKLRAVGAWLDAHPPSSPTGTTPTAAHEDTPAAERPIGRPIPLPLTLTTFHAPSFPTAPPTTPSPVLSHIVLSLALHAALLHRSEVLRASVPGLERFQQAAAQVLDIKHDGTLVLPPDARRWDPVQQTFRPVERSGERNAQAELKLEGPFAYILSSPAVARLEPAFVILPSLLLTARDDLDDGSSERPEQAATMDLVVLRPERSRAVREGGKAAWVERVREVLGGAYKNGVHVDMLLDDPVPDDDGGPGVAEVYRVGSFEFHPSQPARALSDSCAHVQEGPEREELNHLVCADGTIHRVPPSGYVRVRALSRVAGRPPTSADGEEDGRRLEGLEGARVSVWF